MVCKDSAKYRGYHVLCTKFKQLGPYGRALSKIYSSSRAFPPLSSIKEHGRYERKTRKNQQGRWRMTKKNGQSKMVKENVGNRDSFLVM